MVKPVASRGLHNLVVQQLGRLIVSGELSPGAGLPREEALAERLQVSRTALREALKVLTTKGLIESRQRTGARVREAIHWNQLDADILAWRCASMPTDSFVEKLVEMRELIEPGAAAAAARRRTDAQLADLGAAYEAMAAAEDLDAWAEADLAFHERLLRATNNELMASLFSVIETALGTFFRLSASNADNFKAALPHHQRVYEAVRRRQPEKARQAMQTMVSESRDNIAKRPRRKP
ncbi:DNA-binding transcriptional regulator, FadR family [Luteibacter sp. UNCMF331Sha3.1]|uniref:FadR/GntR family transcriptional regulator n=1 Tax=Luteibacter sp. UNCMF331Sha3.1 TaxID=1502760 RepID=UPI0008AE98BA|nr:FadR/GntR family transcriptional regulator [Luteibacter sp. UNCMF331Sha3.1]SEM98026.1 DNA-binding transcriptional regulator, FadR family [Luteibacter sp. UNCMF331Sha3.1]